MTYWEACERLAELRAVPVEKVEEAARYAIRGASAGMLYGIGSFTLAGMTSELRKADFIAKVESL